MATIDAPPGALEATREARRAFRGTLIAASVAVCVAQVGLAIPAVLNGYFQQDLGPTSSQLTWISDAFLVPITLLELTFGVLGDLFGRKRLLIIGSLTLAAGQFVGMLTPGAGTSTGTRVLILWGGQIVAGIGAAAIFPTTLAMVAAGTHTARDRARGITIWAAALAAGGVVSPVAGGWLARFAWGGAPYASWRWAFLLVAVLALASTLVTWVLARTSSAPEGRSLDWPGQITIAIALFALLFAVIQGPTSGWGSGEVIGGFVIAVIFLVLFVLAERRSPAPLLHLDVFANRAFAVAAVATVFGMFAMLGTAYATSIRLSAIQGFTPLKTSIAFVLLNVMALVMVPLTSRVLENYNPRWILGTGFGLIMVGDFWLSQTSAADFSLAPVVVPLLLVGIGFSLALASVTAVAVNTVANHLAGMASGTTSLLRDFGFTLGPAVIGAVALSRAAAEISQKIASSPSLAKAVQAFNASVASAPPAQRGQVAAAVGAVNSGPLGANAVPATVTLPNGHTVPFNPLKDVAFHALDNAYSLGYIICGVSAAVAATLAIVVLRGRAHQTELTDESLAG